MPSLAAVTPQMSGGGSTCAYHPRTEPVRPERRFCLRSFRCSTTGRPPGDFGGDGKVKTTGDRLHLLGRLKFEPAVGCDGSIGEPSFLPSNARILTRAATPTLTPPLGTLIAADSAAWPAWAQLAPTQPPPPISSLTSRQAWVAGGCRQPVRLAHSLAHTPTQHLTRSHTHSLARSHTPDHPSAKQQGCCCVAT